MKFDVVHYQYHNFRPLQKMAAIWPHLIIEGAVKAWIIGNLNNISMDAFLNVI